MKTSLTSQEIKVTFCTVSSSLLLCSSIELLAATAEQETTPWYRQDIPTIGLTTLAATWPGQFSAHPDLRSSSLTTEDTAPTAWEQLYGQPSRQAQIDYLSQGLAVPGTHELKARRSSPCKAPAAIRKGSVWSVARVSTR